MSAGVFPRSYSNDPKPFRFTKLHQPYISPMPSPATYTKPQHRNRRGGFAACCCCCFTTICSLLVTLILILGVAALVVWLVLRPIHLPSYSLDDMQIKTFNINPKATLDANFVYTITATNPNPKIGIKYDVINLDTSYSGDAFGHSSIPGFYQGHQNTTTLTSTLDVLGFALTPSLGSALAADIHSASVPLLMRASVRARLRVGTLTTFPFWLHVNCDVIVSPPTAAAAAKLISHSCNLTR